MTRHGAGVGGRACSLANVFTRALEALAIATSLMVSLSSGDIAAMSSSIEANSSMARRELAYSGVGVAGTVCEKPAGMKADMLLCAGVCVVRGV